MTENPVAYGVAISTEEHPPDECVQHARRAEEAGLAFVSVTDHYEHVTGARWPTPEVRLAMLEEGVQVVRALWSGETVDHHGRFYTVENARLFTLPKTAPPIIVSALGSTAVSCAARIGNGIWCTGPNPMSCQLGGPLAGHGPRIAQLNLCWATHADDAKKTVMKLWQRELAPAVVGWRATEPAVSG